MSETPRVGQVRQHAKVERSTEGAGLTHQPRLVDVTAEAWTGAEWVDVRKLVAHWNGE